MVRLPLEDPAILLGAIQIYAVHQPDQPLDLAARALLQDLVGTT